MARNFASSAYLRHDAAVVTSRPVTLAGWCKQTTAAIGVILNLVKSSGDSNSFSIGLRNDTYKAFSRYHESDIYTISSTSQYQLNTWNHLCGMVTADGYVFSYLNGDAGNSDICENLPAFDFNRTSVGRLDRLTPAYSFTGDIAHVAIWDVVLDVSEIHLLAKGILPLFIRPKSLIAYWPLKGIGLETDYKGKYLFTNSNTIFSSSSPPLKQISRPRYWLNNWSNIVEDNVNDEIEIDEEIASANYRYIININDILTINENIDDEGVSQDPKIINRTIGEHLLINELINKDYQIEIKERILIESRIWGSAVIHNESVEDTIAINEYIPFIVRDVISFTEIINIVKSKHINELIEINEEIGINYDLAKVITDTIDILEIIHYYLLGKTITTLQGQTDLPNSGYLDHVEFVGVGSVSLPVPLFGDQDNKSLVRSMHYNKFGELIYHRQTDLPIIQTIRLQFTQIQLTVLQSFQIFINNNLGKKITYIDYENREWEGIITTPNFRVTENRTIENLDSEQMIPTYDFDIEFLGSMK